MTDRPALVLPPPPFLSDPALQAVLAALPEARLVGGCVRDALAGRRDVADIDLATPRLPASVMQALAAAGLRGVATGLDHGTITAIADHRGFEVTTLRRDVETDGRHAVVAFTDDWQVDAARRDFTINAMSMDAGGAVFDYFAGLADLRAGRVRFVGSAATRIAEDALRILRFFRFQTRYGQGAPDAEAVAAIEAAVPSLARLSCERVWSELKRILAAPDPMAAVRLMERLGVLAAVLPEGAAPDRLGRLVAGFAPSDPLLRLAALLDGDAAALAERLRLSGAERERLLALRGPNALPADADDAMVLRALADTPREIIVGRLALATHATLAARAEALPIPVFPLQGRDVQAAGIPAGPQIGEMLRAIRGWWLAGGCVADAAACRAELARRLAG